MVVEIAHIHFLKELLMVIVLICLIAVLCAALLTGFQAGVFEKDKTKASADLSTRGVQTDGDSGSGSLTSSKLPKGTRRRTNKPNKPVSQITTPDLQSEEMVVQ